MNNFGFLLEETMHTMVINGEVKYFARPSIINKFQRFITLITLQFVTKFIAENV